MAESIYKQNMTYLKSKFNDFYNNLMDPVLSARNITVSETGQNGNYTIKKGDVKCSLHSTYNIDHEMERLFKPIDNDEKQVIVIFGLGYGHCLDYIRKKRIPYKRVVIFEPCTNILMEVLKKKSVLDLLGMKEFYLHLLNTPNAMAQYLLKEAMSSKTVKIIYHLSYMSLFTDIYDNVMRSFKNERIAMESSITTMTAKSIEWNSQQLKSIQLRNMSASALIDRFSGVPAILASAGPSLEKHFGLLREIGDRALIIAPSSSSRIFNEQGLDAHISMSIDSNIISAGLYKDFKVKSILVASYRLHPDVFTQFPNDIYCTVLSTEHLAQYYYNWIGQKPFMINDHSSVSMAAVDLLALMGCDPIILVGQDLSFKENRNYAGDKADSLSDYQKTNSIQDLDIYGNTVYTNYGYKAMQNDMELQNLRYRNQLKMYNATEGGLDIHGIENVVFHDVFDKYIKQRKGDVGDRIANISGARNDTGSASINAFFQHLLDECKNIENVLIDKENSFIPFAKLIRRGVSNNRINEEMKHIQEYNKRLDEINFFKDVVYPNIDSALAFLRAGGKHIADSGEDWEGAMLYEQSLNEKAVEFINTFKALVLREMVSDLVAS